MSKIRLLLADDHAVLRAGLRMLLNAQPDMEVVGEAADGEETLRKTRELCPDIVVMDLTMPGISGLKATEQIREESPEVKVLVLTVHDDESYLHRVLRCGAAAYVPKKAADTELLSAIRATSRGEMFIHSSLTRVLVDDLLRGGSAKERQQGEDRLSEREREILRLLALGHTNREIASMLFLSIKTVETYKARLMAKLNLRGRAELVRYAMEKGLLNIES